VGRRRERGERRGRRKEREKEKKREKKGNYIYTPGIINIELCDLAGRQAVSLVFL